MNWSEIVAKLRDPWAIVGFLGIALFSSRFVVQWLYTEYHKRVVIPVSFWYLSIAGSLVSLVYALHVNEPVYILSFVFNCLVYFRNLYFTYHKGVAEGAQHAPHAEALRKKSA